MNYISCDTPNHFSLKNGRPPELTEGNALLKVKRVGICGTDLHAYKGNQPFFSYPRILGHELATEVIETTSQKNLVSAGDRAVIIPYLNCQQCVSCKAGKSNCCQQIAVLGVHTDGGMQEIISVPNRLLIPANDLSFEEIAIVEPLSIGAHALRRAQTKNGETIVVIGCGPIGMAMIQLAKFLGAKVMVIDVNDYRLSIAKEQFGADATINALHSPLDAVKDFTNGELAHTVFDATGNKRAIEGGLEYMRHGGTFVLVGLFKGELSFYHPSLHAKETTLMSSRNATREDFEFVMKVLREKKFNSGAYITSKVGYQTILTDFDKWSDPASKEIKVMTVWD
ncbi:zinc-binding alcohol dehydrogenase family protein [Chryseolinea sp. H1M3-3]|uniref:zinc-binding alcohol dehydrogenase family protein n=1 Tax=Chryseolinea sp. H1M3-3 TaxID=3034144 RepID=UPI0023EAAB9D|nr:zinc-binding alcohol dehydrogenase family protein [Chryseolinea sp. H1M3-3]